MKRSKHADIHMRIRSDRLCRSPINGGMSRRELCDLIASLEHDNDEMRKKLNALNAHDIEIVDGVAGGYEIYDARVKEIDRLLYENARLHSCLSDLRYGAAIENVRLRNLCREIWMKARLMDANKHIEGMRMLNERGRELEDIMCRLGVISENERLSGHIEDDRPTQARPCEVSR